jgi:Icc-related predicted phosphoesterase
MSGTTGNPRREFEPTEREYRIAAIGDVHYSGSAPGSLVPILAEAASKADVLVIPGDLTTHGRTDQMRGFVEELAAVEIPVVCVLGNHDYEAGEVEACVAILRARGVHVLDGDHISIKGVGFAGTKGFAGGFGRGALAPFGEPEIKQFVQVSLNEAIKLENALRTLDTETRVVVLHYSPIIDTVLGEPDEIHPFLGSSRLLQPIETIGADVIFHGHSHHGSPEGATPSGIPVFNVATQVLKATTGVAYKIYSLPGPERRGAGIRQVS